MFLRLLLVAILSGVATLSFAVDSEPHLKTKICGPDEIYCADVVLDDGFRKLKTDTTVTVEEVFGQDPQGTSWFFFGATLYDANGIGAANDTVRVQIPAAVTPIGTIYPAVDVTYTVTAGDVASSNPERTVAINVCFTLNADANFIAAKWKCEVAKDFALVHIASRLFNEFGTRTSWTVTCSGTTSCNLGYGDIDRRGKPTELSRSPNDPRQGVLAIAGTVSTLPGGIGDGLFEYARNSSSSFNMLLDCDPYVAGTCDFKVNAIANKRRFLESLRCFGGGNGVKFTQFLSKSGSGLTNGILITVRSEGQLFQFEPIKKTEDFKNLFSTEPGNDFRIDVQSGADQFIAQFKPTVPIPIEPSGTVSGGDDYVEFRVRDDLTANIQQLNCSVFGFEREP